MIPQIELGKRVKALRTKTGLTQKEVAAKICVSEQALSKWENGDCLPDLYNLTLLARALHVSTDYLLDTEAEITVETVKIGSAVFEVVEKPAAIFAGKILQAKDFPDMQGFYSAVELLENEGFAACNALSDPALPLEDIHLSVNFWREEKERAFGAVREVLTNCQPSGVDLYQAPASLYIRAHTDQATATNVRFGSFLPIFGTILCRAAAIKWQNTARRSLPSLITPSTAPAGRMCL